MTTFRYKGCTVEVTGPSDRKLAFLRREIFGDLVYDVSLRRDDPVVFDCGANIGCATLFFKSRYPRASVHAFEPQRAAFDYLMRNLTRNQMTSVFTYELALGYPERSATLFCGREDASLRASLNPSRSNWVRSESVCVQRLSQFLRSERQVDLVKLDVEGNETEIVNDLLDAELLGFPDNYVIEYHHNISGRAGGLSAFLRPFEQAGYMSSLRASRVQPGEPQDILIYLAKPGSAA